MPRVLIVDDQKDVRDLLGAALQDQGVESVAAADGGSALRELCRATADGNPFDAMLLDIVMPGIDGWRVMAAVKSNPLWEDLPIIVITGQATGADDIWRVTEFDGVYAEKGTSFLDFVLTTVSRIIEAGED